MTLYVITERQNLQSLRTGQVIWTKNLTAAKRMATAGQAFQGTVLTIETPAGLELAFKKNGKWTDVD